MIRRYSEFLLEKETQGQLQMIALAVSVNMPDNEYIYNSKYNVSKIFKLLTKDKNAEPTNMPVFNYSNWKVKKMVKDGWDPNLIYNNVESKQKVSSKAHWHKIHEDSDYTPNVVFSKDDIKNLSFPVIAKPDNRYGGQGIVVFKKPDDLTDAKLEDFSVFSEMIDIKEEIRIFCWKGRPLMHVYRVPANNETKDLSKDPDDRLKFNYELSQHKLNDDLMEVVQEFSQKHEDLHFYSIDIAVDKKGHPYVIEMSSEPGPIFGVMGHVYKEMYIEHFGESLSYETNKLIDTYIEEDINQTIKSDKDRFKLR
jgi:hypothetical protein